MAKMEWGIKRTCQACGARYYDFGRSPVVCPSPNCATVYDPEAVLKSRRARIPTTDSAGSGDGGSAPPPPASAKVLEDEAEDGTDEEAGGGDDDLDDDDDGSDDVLSGVGKIIAPDKDSE